MTRVQQQLLDWYGGLVEVYKTKFTDQEKLELERWELANLDGHSVCTSDWPGWKKYLRKRPGTDDNRERRRSGRRA